MSMINILRKSYQNRHKYIMRNNRNDFYNITSKYLPHDRQSIILDIGSGADASFVNHLNIFSRFPKTYLLDGNSVTVNKLKQKRFNVILYKIPNVIPFNDAEVTFIHCSHVVEHLYPEQLYIFLKEIDRVLTEAGILVISTPMVWSGFYSDLTHIKPYNASVFRNYLGNTGSNSRSMPIISDKYKVLEQVYRYREESLNDEGLGAKSVLLDTLFQCCKYGLWLLGVRFYIRNGYTLVLQKGGVNSNNA